MPTQWFPTWNLGTLNHFGPFNEKLFFRYQIPNKEIENEKEKEKEDRKFYTLDKLNSNPMWLDEYQKFVWWITMRQNCLILRFFSSFLQWIFLCCFHFHFVVCAFLRNIKKKSFLLSVSTTLIASVYIFMKGRSRQNGNYDTHT